MIQKGITKQHEKNKKSWTRILLVCAFFAICLYLIRVVTLFPFILVVLAPIVSVLLARKAHPNSNSYGKYDNAILGMFMCSFMGALFCFAGRRQIGAEIAKILFEGRIEHRVEYIEDDEGVGGDKHLYNFIADSIENQGYADWIPILLVGVAFLSIYICYEMIGKTDKYYYIFRR